MQHLVPAVSLWLCVALVLLLLPGVRVPGVSGWLHQEQRGAAGTRR
jgi:hypothetical protein